MRYYGKEGPQCKLPADSRCQGMERCRDAAHAVLFGRVSRSVVMWLGLGVMAVVLTLGFWGLSELSGRHTSFVRDQGSAIIIHR